MLLNFWQNYKNAMNIYMLCICIWKSCMQEYMKVSYETYAWVHLACSCMIMYKNKRIWTDKMWISSVGGNYLDPSLWRQLKLWDPSTLEAIGQNEIPPSLEVYGSPCRLVLCNDGHELSPLLDQTTQGQ